MPLMQHFEAPVKSCACQVALAIVSLPASLHSVDNLALFAPWAHICTWPTDALPDGAADAAMADEAGAAVPLSEDMPSDDYGNDGEGEETDAMMAEDEEAEMEAARRLREELKAKRLVSCWAALLLLGHES